MDSFPHNNYMRPPLPPPPPMADPPHQYPPPQTSSPWYSHSPPQFHYPPPNQQHNWAPPPQSDHHNGPLPYPPNPHPYPPPPPPPPLLYQNQFPLSHHQRPHLPPPPPFPILNPNPNPNPNQDWGNANWGPHAGWEHQAHSNGEDWGAKARAWAAAKNSVETQHPSAQSHYPSQYMQPPDSHYHENEQINVHSSPYQNYPIPAAPVDKQHIAHQPEPATYYGPDGNFSYARKDGIFPDMGTAYPQQDAFTSPSVHKQEVPSSYSSIPGGQFSSEQQPKGSGSRDSMLDQSQFSYGNQSVSTNTDPSDQPLQFTPRFNHDNNPMMVAGYLDQADPAKVMDSGSTVPTLQPWTSPAPPSISFPSASPTFPSAAQLDPTVSMPPLPGQPPPMHGRAPVPNFHSAVPSLSSPIGLGIGTSFHPSTAFHGDLYGAPMNSERPKKAAVPNWLRDEIIKKKDVIVSSGADHHKEESESIDDEVEKAVSKSDQTDSKSIDSSRSNEEEDEDYEEVSRTAAINQEIKRVLTEVLLNVTSDLFDEIATRVLDEDDNPIKAKNEYNAQNQKPSSPRPAFASKVSEKIPISVKINEPKSDNVSEESSPGAAGNVLGLVNYASDDDDDDEAGNSVVSKSDKSSKNMSSSSKEVVEGTNATFDAHSPPDLEKLDKNIVNAGSKRASHFDDSADRRGDKKLNSNGAVPPQLNNPVERKTDSVTDNGRVIDSFDESRAHSSSRKEPNEPEAPAELVKKGSKDDFRERKTRRHDRQENRSSSARDSAKEAEKIETKENNKVEQIHVRHEERHQRKKSEDHSGSKDRIKEQGVKYEEKSKERDSKKRSPHRHAKKASEKDDAHRKSERLKDEKGDRSKHKHASDRGRHKRRRSSSVDSRGRNSKDTSGASYSDNSTDEASGKSRRKTHSKRRDLSPSPVRSRRRQVSQSPPSSKASQRRHSPYSSLEASRGRKSRSRLPAHRRR